MTARLYTRAKVDAEIAAVVERCADAIAWHQDDPSGRDSFESAKLTTGEFNEP